MLDFTFLTKEQCYDSSKILEILKKRGTIAPITDFAILLGGFVDDKYHYNNSDSLEDRSGYYWTSSIKPGGDAYVVCHNGDEYYDYACKRDVGARPVVSCFSIRNISTNAVREKDGILEVECGEYPQKAASKELQEELEIAYNQSFIEKTGKAYTIDSREYYEFNKKFKGQFIEEYLFDNGKKYVRVKAQPYCSNSEFKLSNGEKYKDGNYVWVEVEPIKWLIDEQNDIALAERILFAGVQFYHEIDYKNDFRTTDVKWFMDTCFSNDIIPCNIKVNFNGFMNRYFSKKINSNNIKTKKEINNEELINLLNSDNEKYSSLELINRINKLNVEYENKIKKSKSKYSELRKEYILKLKKIIELFSKENINFDKQKTKIK